MDMYCIIDSGQSDAYLQFQKGDLLLLSDDFTGASLIKSQFVKGENVATGLQGTIPTNMVQILPTICKPSVDIMVTFKIYTVKGESYFYSFIL